MGVRKRKQPTKVQAIFTGILALMLLANTASAVLVEGRPATVFFWLAMALDLALLVLSLWLYRRAAKNPPTRE
jgi:uncharacterized membrane protein